MRSIDRAIVGGIPTARISRAQLAAVMVEHVAAARAGELLAPKLMFSSNGSVIARYHVDKGFRALFDSADVIDPDGMPLVIASRILCRKPLPERVATTDFILDACAAAQGAGIRFFFLGGIEGNARKAADSLVAAYPGLRIVGTRHGYFSETEEAGICDEIVGAGTDILWLGLGSPLQEQFAVRNRDRLKGLAWIKTCGGLFDHFTGQTKRAPIWMQNLGLEWLARTAQEPRRLAKRYLLSNPVAAYYLSTQTFDLPVADKPIAPELSGQNATDPY